MDKPADDQQSVEEQKPKIGVKRNVTLAMAAGALGLVLLGFGIGWIAQDHFDWRRPAAGKVMTMAGPEAGYARGMMHGGMHEVNPTDGTAISRLSGVVTQVNGDSFTIAGSGTTKTIKTTSSTTYNVS